MEKTFFMTVEYVLALLKYILDVRLMKGNQLVSRWIISNKTFEDVK
ncbi:hypothetical protein QA612_06100 [Evansella sp. AB-P1]|nr:hypothetical protein [Evansella sp. AB-P1]MDG5787058.1 hypothetical protein [Evansella sp. AB-P1]